MAMAPHSDPRRRALTRRLPSLDGVETPTVSLGVPVHNGERYLRTALDSIRAQSFPDFDVLISDNASTDGTESIARDFCRLDPRFRYHRHAENIGASGNFNFVFANTRGRYFKWAAHDDALRPDFLLKCVETLDEGPGSRVLAVPQTTNIDQDGREIGRYLLASGHLVGTPSERLAALLGPAEERKSILHMCYPVFGLIRRSALEETGIIANMPRSDNLLLVELALLGSFAEVSADLFLRRSHAGGSVIAAERATRGPEIERLLAAWFDPRRGKRFPATTTRLGLGYMRAILRTPMTAGEKLKCMVIATGWIARRSRIIGGEVKIVLRDSVSRRA